MSTWMQVRGKIYLSKLALKIESDNVSSLMAKSKGLPWKDINKFAILQKELGYNLTDLEHLADTTLSKERYLLNDVIDLLGISEMEFRDVFLSANTKGMTEFNLRGRALHVIQGNLPK